MVLAPFLLAYPFRVCPSSPPFTVHSLENPPCLSYTHSPVPPSTSMASFNHPHGQPCPWLVVHAAGLMHGEVLPPSSTNVMKRRKSFSRTPSLQKGSTVGLCGGWAGCCRQKKKKNLKFKIEKNWHVEGFPCFTSGNFS